MSSELEIARENWSYEQQVLEIARGSQSYEQ